MSDLTPDEVLKKIVESSIYDTDSLLAKQLLEAREALRGCMKVEFADDGSYATFPQWIEDTPLEKQIRACLPESQEP